MSEKTILTKLNSLEEELRTLVCATRANSAVLQNLADTVSDRISRQVYNMKDLAIRWNCSEVHAREIVSHYGIQLVLSKNNQPRRPYCVLLSEIFKFENRGETSHRRIVLSPPAGKTARGFLPYQESAHKPRRLGDFGKDRK